MIIAAPPLRHAADAAGVIDIYLCRCCQDMRLFAICYARLMILPRMPRARALPLPRAADHYADVLCCAAALMPRRPPRL